MNFGLKLFFLICVFCSCETRSQYVCLRNEEKFAYAKEVKCKYDLELIGFGGGLKCEDFDDLVSLTFLSKRNYNFEATRWLFVSIVEGFLERINRNTALLQYHSNEPFTIRNFELMIIFPRIENASVSTFPSGVCMNHSLGYRDPISILYTTCDVDATEITSSLWEPYETAREIVMGQVRGDCVAPAISVSESFD